MSLFHTGLFAAWLTMKIETRRAAGSILHHLTRPTPTTIWPPHDTVTRRASRAPRRVGLACQLSIDMATWLERDFLSAQICKIRVCLCLWKTGAHKNGKSIIRRAGNYMKQERNPGSCVDGSVNKIIPPLFPPISFFISVSLFLARFCVFRSQMGGPPLRGNCIINIPKATPTACFSPLCHTLFSPLVTLQGRYECEFPGLSLNEAAIQSSIGRVQIKPHRQMSF